MIEPQSHRDIEETQQKCSLRRPMLMLLCLCFALCLGASVVNSVCPTRGDGDAEWLSATTREGRLAIFDDVWETIRERYYDPTLHGVDWQSLGATFRPLAAEARDTQEFYTFLRRMINRLGDAHTRIYAPGERSDWLHPSSISVGVSVREMASEIVVTDVERGSEAEHEGVRAGDAVVSIDGELARTVFARRLDEQVGSSTIIAAHLQAAARIFNGTPNSFATVIFAGDDGHQKIVWLQRLLHPRLIALRVSRTGKYGVVRFNSFTQEIATQFVRALKNDLRGARGLILDLRDNGGGEAEAMTDVASAFIPAGTNMGRFTDREGRVTFELQARTSMLFAADAVPSFGGPVIILTSAKTASAAEIFVSALKEAHRATIIGEETCGCVLGIRRPHPLPDGGMLDISEMDYHTASGARLEGSSMTPDERVTFSRRDLRAGYDRTMEHAIEFLKATGQR